MQNYSVEMYFYKLKLSECYILQTDSGGMQDVFVYAQSQSHVQLSAIQQSVAHQASLFMGFSRKEY